MTRPGLLKAVLAGSVCSAALLSAASARNFAIPGGDLESALSAYASQSGVSLIVSDDEVKGVRTKGVTGDMSDDVALSHILSGTGFVVHRHPSGKLGIARDDQSSNTVQGDFSMQLAQATPAPTRTAVETVTVTSSKLGGADVQSVPIAITALSQEQLTATQTAGGPDLVKQVPNLTFTKTNFTGYSIQIRGIGTQAISVTTDPAVAVALNDIPFIRNHFFEQEFYDLGQAEVLRGPQGTLYGRNATAGVVNLITAKPTDQFEAMASGDIGNYHNRRFEGMINLPIVDDWLDIRLAGEWTKRQGYSFNELTDQRIDGRDLWSGRLSIAWRPFANVHTTLVWEHFSEDDDRMRTAKQLCKTAPIPDTVGGVPVASAGSALTAGDYLSQGCLPTSLYSADAFQVPNGYALAYASGISTEDQSIRQAFDVYSSTTQSRNLRVIESTLNPVYKAKNDTVELNTDYQLSPALTFTSQTGYNQDFLWSTEDYDRFNSAPGIFVPRSVTNSVTTDPNGLGICGPSGCSGGLTQGATCTVGVAGCSADGVFCDPQLGCSDRLVAQDLSDEHAWQLSQEFRLTSNFRGPFNFSVGGNYLHYETEENYYVFINTLGQFSFFSDPNYIPGVSDNTQCLQGGLRATNPAHPGDVQQCGKYADPNPISSLNNQGHNYFLSQNPYTLNSYAMFGETYFNITNDIKLTGGLRWTEDQKHFTDIPSELLLQGYGYIVTGIVNQQWDQFTGRAAVDWTPHLTFTDQTLLYGSYSHGYKAGGANPPGALFPIAGNSAGGGSYTITDPVHPLTFKPEFVDAFEIGTKNTLLDGTLTFNGDVFYYNYENYQISEIVDRTAINLNFDSHVKGAEIESTWEPVPGLRFNFAGGWEDTSIAKGAQAVDLMDRTAGNSNWIVVKPFITEASNCILPTYVVAAGLHSEQSQSAFFETMCDGAYNEHLDPITLLPYDPANPTAHTPSTPAPPAGYPGFDPTTAPNNGEGFDKDLSGNQLPNAPPFTVSFGAQYTIPVTTDWAATLRGDYYWQDYSWARVFNDNPYDRLRGYTNVNLTLILTSQSGWQVMLYDKNIFNETAITGDFLNSDDTGLTTNVFLTDPKLIGIRVTKNW